ncbi:MAG: 2'-5' RNA ligase family protein, partial [bacterium]|nr:2'-5' RNA ligase family protein [bacterium]
MIPYTLWLVPQEPVRTEYQTIIDEYCKKFSIHTFEPHITLTGGIESVDEQTIQSIQQVIENAHPIDVSISEVSISTTYFQCVFARVTPTPELLDLQINLRSACNIVAEDFFMPHLSLVYATISSEEK